MDELDKKLTIGFWFFMEIREGFSETEGSIRYYEKKDS